MTTYVFFIYPRCIFMLEKTPTSPRQPRQPLLFLTKELQVGLVAGLSCQLMQASAEKVTWISKCNQT